VVWNPEFNVHHKVKSTGFSRSALAVNILFNGLEKSDERYLEHRLELNSENQFWEGWTTTRRSGDAYPDFQSATQTHLL
jgi:hypothetical protein